MSVFWSILVLTGFFTKDSTIPDILDHRKHFLSTLSCTVKLKIIIIKKTPFSFVTFQSNRSGMGGRPFTPLVNAESAEKAIYSKIHKHWKEVQRRCRQFDPNSTGVISQQQFRGKVTIAALVCCNRA